MFDGTRRLDADTYPLRLSVGGRETDVGTVSLSPRTVSVSMSDQRSANGRLLQVDSAYLPDGGFISIHDARAFERGDVAGSILGTSGYLSAGGHDHVRVTLDESLSDGTNRVVAIPYRDVDENAIFDVGHANRQNDEPYEVGGSEVTDSAAVSVPTPTPTKTSSTTTTTTTSATTTTPSATTTSTTLPSTTDEADASANSPGFGGGVTVLALVLAVIAAYLRRPPEEPRA